MYEVLQTTSLHMVEVLIAETDRTFMFNCEIHDNFLNMAVHYENAKLAP